MLKLEETNHSYYCEVYETQGTGEWGSWKEFKEDRGLDYDFDCNLLFRYDLLKDEDTGEFYLQLHHALQRHGYSQWHCIIHNITEEDLEEINKHLKNAWKYLKEMWIEIEKE